MKSVSLIAMKRNDPDIIVCALGQESELKKKKSTKATIFVVN